MLFCYSFIAVLLYDTVLAEGCTRTFTTSPRTIEANARTQLAQGYQRCEFYIQAFANHVITLNVTRLYGFDLFPGVHDTPKCLPRLKFTEIAAETGIERTMSTICQKNNNIQPPKVFQSSSGWLKLTCEWPDYRSLEDNSGFSLTYFFHERKKPPCELKCGDGSCLAGKSLVCNNVADCLDGSDEQDCVSQQLTYGDDADTSQIVVIVIGVVLTLVVISCFLYWLRVCGSGDGCAMVDTRRRHLSDSSTEHNHLNPSSSPSHTHSNSAEGVVYVPGEQWGTGDLSMFEDQSNTADIMLPPAIPLAQDGEEGYANCQRLVPTRDTTEEIYRESVCAPPNRTIQDCESPPPYRSRSVGSIGQMEYYKGGNKKSVKLADNANSSDSSSVDSIVRCYSLSSNNNNKVGRVQDCVTSSPQPPLPPCPPVSVTPAHSSSHHLPHVALPPYTSHHHARSPSEGATAVTSPAHNTTSSSSSGGPAPHHCDPPPDYCDVIANMNVYNRHSRPSSNSGSGV